MKNGLSFMLGMIVLSLFVQVYAMGVQSLEDLREVESKVKSAVLGARKATVSLYSDEVKASGSGIIMTNDGLIMTAAHVVEGSREVVVIFEDGRQEVGMVLGAKYTRDAALVKLVGEGPWPYVTLGDSKKLKVGDFVIALGHPKGYDPTRNAPVRFGRILTRMPMGFLTSDCTLIAGDSGGPLLSLEGQLVGIHSHIGEEKRINNHAEVAGFLRSWDKMLTGRQWGSLGGDQDSRPVIGVRFAKVEDEEDRLLVSEVLKHSPAERAQIKVGDVILKVDGVDASSAKDVRELLLDYEAGDEVEILLERDGREKMFVLKLLSVSEVREKQGR